MTKLSSGTYFVDTMDCEKSAALPVMEITGKLRLFYPVVKILGLPRPLTDNKLICPWWIIVCIFIAQSNLNL